MKLHNSKTFDSRWLGLVSYDDGLAIQSEVKAKISTEEKNDSHYIGQILGLEHHSVITLGKRGEIGKDILFSSNQLEDLGVEVRSADRGGQATLHSPGQLVIYPILSMSNMDIGVKDLVCGFLRATISTLKELGVQNVSSNDEGTGVFVGEKKISYCGLRISQGISTHGISINVSNDLELFGAIRSCGVSEARLESLANLGITISCSDLFEVWLRSYRKILS